MPEEIKNIRLNKAARELNVGVQTLVEFLAKKGHTVEANPNTRLTPEQYGIIAEHFKGEREVKINADKLEISTNNAETIEVTPIATPKEDEEELTIKSNGLSSPSIEEKKEEPIAADPVQEEKPQAPEPEPPVQEEAADEEPANDNNDVEEQDAPEEPAFEPQVIRSNTENNVGNFNPELRILDKIDLSAINDKTRPSKRSKKDKKKANNEAPKPATPKAPVAQEPKATPAAAPVVETPVEYA